jgi:hypothetical protein
MNFREVPPPALDDLLGHPLHGRGDVGKQARPLVVVKQVEQGPVLALVVVVLTVVITVRVGRDLQGRFGVSLVLHRTVAGIGLVVGIGVRVVAEMITNLN